MDDEFSTRRQEQRDLLLGPSSDFSRQRRWIRDRERKTVRVSGHLWILGQCEVVPEEDRTVREIARPQNRGRRRVRDCHIPFTEQEEHRLSGACRPADSSAGAWQRPPDY